MAIITEAFNRIGANNEVVMYMIYDDKNTTNTTRWRIQQIRVVNGSATTSYACYVEDPANPGVRYPDADPNAEGWQPVWVPPGQTMTWDVPVQFQNNSPYEYNWGAI